MTIDELQNIPGLRPSLDSAQAVRPLASPAPVRVMRHEDRVTLASGSRDLAPANISLRRYQMRFGYEDDGGTMESARRAYDRKEKDRTGLVVDLFA